MAATPVPVAALGQVLALQVWLEKPERVAPVATVVREVEGLTATRIPGCRGGVQTVERQPRLGATVPRVELVVPAAPAVTVVLAESMVMAAAADLPVMVVAASAG